VKRGGSFASASLLVFVLASSSARGDDGASTAPPRRVEGATAAPSGAEPVRYPPTSVRLPLILGGLGFSAAIYGATAGSAVAWPDAPGASKLTIPVAGPWLALAENRCPSDGSSCDAMVYVRGILEVLSGLAQAGGLALAVEGFVATTEASAPATSTVRVTPTVTPTMAGLTLGGTF
jgi:hypothetical protein